MLLTVKKRQTYLKAIGLYEGKIDGKQNDATKKAYLKLQKKYFTRKSDIDGKYGKDTDILLRNAYRVHKWTKNFKLEEFKCGCGGKYCTGYPVVLNPHLLNNIQTLRNKYGAMTITSGMRDTKHNASLVGSSATSRHLKGKAVDFVCADSKTLAGRKKIMAEFKRLPNFHYTYCNENGNHPNMGNAIHIDVK